jgi:hypothetical protein
MPVNFDLQISNFGNRTIAPAGTVYIYNRRGQEIAQLPVDTAADPLPPGSEKTYAYSWSPERALGKYKAKVELGYGIVSKRDMMDTVFFWIMPKGLLFAFIGGALLLVILLSVLIFRKTFRPAALPARPKKGEQQGVLNLKE